jgi:MFS family permease
MGKPPATSTAPAAGRAAPRTLFNRHFLLLWQGQLVSQIGNELHMIAMMFWVKHATGSASLMGIIMMVAMLPGVLLGPAGGAFADRFSRRRTIIVTDAVRGLAVLCLAAIILTAPGKTEMIIGWIFAMALIAGTMGAFFRPAISAAIPDLVPAERLAAANSLNQSSSQVAVFVGQGVGGVLFRILGAPILFLIDGCSYLFSAASESLIRIPQKLAAERLPLRHVVRAFHQDILAGFRYIWRRTGLRNLMLVATLLNFLLAPFGVLLPFYVEDHLGVTSDWFGFLLAAIGAGALIGYALAGLWRPTPRRRMIVVTAALVSVGLLFALLGMTRSPWTALATMLAIGITSGLINVHVITILQISTPPEVRGRIFGFVGTLAGGLAPIGMGLAGVAADLVDQNVARLYLACGIAATVTMLLLSLNGPYREFLAYEPERSVAEPS